MGNQRSVETMILALVVLCVGCEARMHVESRPSTTKPVTTAVAMYTVATEATDARPDVDDDTLRRAVLEKVGAEVGFGLHNIAHDVTARDIARQRKTLACLRQWTLRSIGDPRLKDAYLQWIDFYDDEANKAEQALLFPAVREPSYEEQEAEKERHVREVARSLPTPEPCDLPKKGTTR